MARRTKPSDPEAARLARRAQDLEAVNLPADAATLPRQDSIEPTRKGQKRASDGKDGKVVDADECRRLDAFSALRSGMVQGAYDAARRFELDLLTRLGMTERGTPMERVDCTAGHTTDAMRLAGIRVDEVMDRLAPRDGWLLVELIAPPIDRGTWRDHVLYITGETHAHAQGSVVRAVCVNLRDAYAALERKAA
jgi:hypothetical protein